MQLARCFQLDEIASGQMQFGVHLLDSLFTQPMGSSHFSKHTEDNQPQICGYPIPP
jgi:hypothetical protein